MDSSFYFACFLMALPFVSGGPSARLDPFIKIETRPTARGVCMGLGHGQA